MKKTTLLFMVFIAAIVRHAAAYDIHDETLRYRVMYKWGLINKQAGSVTIDTESTGDGFFNSKLTGRSASWADHIYSVRDTLLGRVNATTYEPVFYEKIAREDGDYKHDRITFHRKGQDVIGKCHRVKRRKKDSIDTVIDTTLHATGMTVDILSAFYYMRHLDYARMKPGESVKATIFSGKKKELLRITYHGVQSIEIDRKNVETYYITFTFTSDEGKKSSDDMFAWISTDPRRVPLKMKGNLPIGSIQCFLED